MTTVCVGCGLDVDSAGKIQIDRAATELHLEKSFVDFPGGVVPATFETAIGPTLCIEATNPSECRRMMLKGSVDGNAKLAWDVGTETIYIVPSFSIDGGLTWTDGSQIGIAGPATTWTEGRYVAITFDRQVAELAPGQTLIVCMRYVGFTQNAVTPSFTDLGMVFHLDGVYID